MNSELMLLLLHKGSYDSSGGGGLALLFLLGVVILVLWYVVPYLVAIPLGILSALKDAVVKFFKSDSIETTTTDKKRNAMMLRLRTRGGCTVLVDDENIIYDIGDVKVREIRNKPCGPHACLLKLYLSGVDFRNLDLSYSNMLNAELKYADLRGTNLSEANLEGADFEYCLFDERTVFPAGYRIHHKIWDYERDVKRVSYETTEVRNRDGELLFMLNSDSLSGCHLNDLDLSNADFRGQDLTDVNFDDSILDGADFSGADLRGSGIFWDDHRRGKFIYDDDTVFDHHTHHRPSYM